MEQDYEEKMKELKDSFEFEKKRKADLEKELTNVKQELENIEIKFPQEVQELREQIEYAKQQTFDYEKRTRELQTELNNLKLAKK